MFGTLESERIGCHAGWQLHPDAVVVTAEVTWAVPKCELNPRGQHVVLDRRPEIVHRALLRPPEQTKV